VHLFFNKIFMELRFIGQGYNLETNTSVAQVLIDNLNNEAFHTFKCMVAFASPSGVSGLAEHVNNSRNHIATTRVIVGIDQLATSKEALEKLLEWNADVFVFYSNQPNIFHPKIYIFEGENLVSILIGSNNLTEMGLVKNIEASLLITFNKDEMQGESLLDQINTYFDTVLNGVNPNLKSLTTELITQLVAKGIVPTETERRAKYSKTVPQPAQEGNEELNIDISDLFPSIGLQDLPNNFKPAKRERVIQPLVPTKGTDGQNPIVLNTDVNYVEVWKSRPLSERDLNIPSGPNTNATGSMLLKKGLLRGVDHRHYFKDQVFSGLDWQDDPSPNHKHLKRSKATFRININDINMGEFVLDVNHNSDVTSRSYEQRNAMTNISWGEAKEIIAKQELLGKTLTLFKDTNSEEAFLIKIN
jgi:HKD family nuclease